MTVNEVTALARFATEAHHVDVRWASLTVAIGVLGLGAAAPAASRESRVLNTRCCLRVIIDAGGTVVVDHGPKTDDQRQHTAGKYTLDWSYHLRGIATYLDGPGKPLIYFMVPPRSSRLAAVLSASLEELDQIEERAPSGWYPQVGSSSCAAEATIDIKYRPWPGSRGGDLVTLLIPLGPKEFSPNCPDGNDAYYAGLFAGGGVFGGYTGYRFPFPSAHRADLRRGTMHASTICSDWLQKAKAGPSDYAFAGYMTEKVSLDSFAPSQLGSTFKELKAFVGKVGRGSNFDSDPFSLDPTTMSMKTFGKPGCHKP